MTDFKEIIKQEWEKEYPLAEGQEPYNFEDSLFSIYHELVERICVRVWNSALEYAADNADADYTIIDENEPDDPVLKEQIEVYVIKNSILKHKL